MSDDYDVDAEAIMAIEEDEAERGYYAQQRHLAEAIDRGECGSCGGWYGGHRPRCES